MDGVMRLSNYCIVLVLFLSAAAVTAADLRAINRKLTEKQKEPGTGIVFLASEALKHKPENADEAIWNFVVFTKAGMNAETEAAATDIKRFTSGKDAESFISSAVSERYDGKALKPASTLVLLTIFEKDVTDQGLVERFLDDFVRDGKSVDEMNLWLSERVACGNPIWISVRNKFALKHGGAAAVLASIEREIRNNPSEVQPVIDYLEAKQIIDRIRYSNKSDSLPVPETAWLKTVVTPSATGLQRIGEAMRYTRDRDSAVYFLKKALVTPLSDSEKEKTDEKTFRKSVMKSMAGCLDGKENKEIFAAWTMKAGGIPKPRRSSNFSSGEKPSDPDDMAAWLKYARDSESESYFDDDKAEARINDAVRAALQYARTPANKDPKRDSDSAEIIQVQNNFYKRLNKHHKAHEALFDVLEKVDASDPTAIRAIRCINLTPHGINHSDQRLWAWLQSRPEWEFTEQNLLQTLIFSARGDRRRDLILSTEAMTEKKDISCSFVLARVAFLMNEPEIALRLLDKCLKSESPSVSRKNVAYEKLNIIAARPDWKESLRCFEIAGDSCSDKLKFLTLIAAAAAENGETDEALKLWKQASDIDISYTTGLDRISRTAAQDKFIGFYREIQKTIPSSDVITAALKILGAEN